MAGRIAIITVTRNDLAGLKLTSNSILPFLNEDVVWIIVDGNSTDGSKEFISSLRDSLYWSVSEADDGIYDAMNKGALHAPSDSYLLWINSGDQLIFLPDLDVSYDAFFYSVAIKETGKIKVPAISPVFSEKSISPYSQYYHQGFLVKKCVFSKYMYDSSIGLSADMLLMLQIVKSHKFMIANNVLSIYSANGRSNREVWRLLASHFFVVSRLGLSKIKYSLLNFSFIIKCIIKILLPFSLVIFYRNIVAKIR